MNSQLTQSILAMYRNDPDQSGADHKPLVKAILEELIHHNDILPESIWTKEGNLTDSQAVLASWFECCRDFDLSSIYRGFLRFSMEILTFRLGESLDPSLEEAIQSVSDSRRMIINPTGEMATRGCIVVVKKDEDAGSVESLDKHDLGQVIYACRKLIAQNICQAVWLVYADTGRQIVEEPEPTLGWSHFLENLTVF